jgi:hypothetical protein
MTKASSVEPAREAAADRRRRVTIDERRRLTAAQLSALTLANAMIFQSELSQVDNRVQPLRRSLDGLDPVQALVDHWQYICEDINYVPIFDVARRILLETPNREEMHRALRELARQVQVITARRAALRHDLMGRIYHQLLLEAKYLGTYYTSVPAANLLAKVTIGVAPWDVDWGDIAAVQRLNIADLACGTGTLLLAVQQAITDQFVRAMAASGEHVSPDHLRALHGALMEDVLHGYDVLASAVHLTASTLALLAPEISFRRTRLVRLPLGLSAGGDVNLGSIEFLHGAQGLAAQVGLMPDERDAPRAEEVPAELGGRGERLGAGTLPELDWCIMNPPFTRSVGGNLLFGNLPRAERQQMQRKLAALLRPAAGRPAVLANSTAGLGSVFVATAHRYLKPGGRLSLVLPAAVASGVAWQKTRQLLAQEYKIDCVIASHDPDRWNFSENTDLSEVLIAARRRLPAEDTDTHRVMCVNLWQNTNTPVDALALAEAIITGPRPALEEGHGIGSVVIGGIKRGELFSVAWPEIRGGQWYTVSLAQTDLVRASYHLRRGNVFLPGVGVAGRLPATAGNDRAVGAGHARYPRRVRAGGTSQSVPDALEPRRHTDAEHGAAAQYVPGALGAGPAGPAASRRWTAVAARRKNHAGGAVAIEHATADRCVPARTGALKLVVARQATARRRAGGESARLVAE